MCKNLKNWRSVKCVCGRGGLRGIGDGGRSCRDLFALPSIPLRLPAARTLSFLLPSSSFVHLGRCSSLSDMTVPAGSWRARSRRIKAARALLWVLAHKRWLALRALLRISQSLVGVSHRCVAVTRGQRKEQD